MVTSPLSKLSGEILFVDSPESVIGVGDSCVISSESFESNEIDAVESGVPQELSSQPVFSAISVAAVFLNTE